MITVNFVCREGKKDKFGYASIELTLCKSGKRVYVNLDRKEKPSVFKKVVSSVKPSELKSYLDSEYRKVQDAISSLSVSGCDVTPQSVKDYLKADGNSVVYTVNDLQKDFLNMQKCRCSYENWRRYELSINLFLSEVFDGNKAVSEVLNSDILMYEGLLKDRYDDATIYSYLVRLKAMFVYALNNGKITANPFYGIRLRKGEKEIETMSVSEYERLRDKDISIWRLAKVRDLLVFCCNSGISFADIIKLRKEDFNVIGGSVIVEKERQKTGVKFYSVILPDGVSVLEKYDYDLSSILMSNQKVNTYAHELEVICGLSCSLHYHLCRHFYVTTLIRNGVDISVVQRCAGHSNIKMTNRYIHLCREDIVNGVLRHF